MCDMKLNNVTTMVFSDLLKDGRIFNIPSYQRGYRWSERQVKDLLNDLFEFALKKDKIDGEFYCLQPVIVVKEEGENTWEVVDGQQRLTTLYILYRFLMNFKKYNSEELLSKKKKILYHIKYETRPDDDELIEKLGFEECCYDKIKDIDIAHVFNAFVYMKDWLYSESPKDSAIAIYKKRGFEDECDPENVVDCLFGLLNNSEKSGGNTYGCVKFIWYELDPSKNSIKEFVDVNKGKIPLTDTELIKGLLLQRRNFEKGESDLKQLSIAFEWEQIENTLHKDDFWGFLSTDFNSENRIDLIFSCLYQKECGCMPKNEKGDLFRFFENKITSQEESVDDLWSSVMNNFRMLKNWYSDPLIYNYIGILTRIGVSVFEIAEMYNDEGVSTTAEFVSKLRETIYARWLKNILNGISLESEYRKDAEDPKGIPVGLRLSYQKDRKAIKILFMLLNAESLCVQVRQQLERVHKEEEEKKKTEREITVMDCASPIYRFPYDVVGHLRWDAEHIDSANTNKLKKTSDKETWLENAIKVLDVKDEEIVKKWTDAKNGPKQRKDGVYNELIQQIRVEYAREDDDPERRNWIGNMTLLEAGMNRGYGNALFIDKHDEVQKWTKRGEYLPVFTKNVFNKDLDGCDKKNMLWWHLEDKIANHDFILKKIIEFNEGEHYWTSDDNKEIREKCKKVFENRG